MKRLNIQSIFFSLIFISVFACKAEPKSNVESQHKSVEIRNTNNPEPDREATKTEVIEEKNVSNNSIDLSNKEDKKAKVDPSSTSHKEDSKGDIKPNPAIKENHTENKSTTPPVESENEASKPEMTTKTEEERPAIKQKPIKPEVVNFNHDRWNALLRSHVSDDGRVGYELLKNREAQLDIYLAGLEKNPPKPSWSESKKLAYWINAYNAYTVKMILDNYPVSSIKDLHDGKPWDVKWIKLDGKTLSLNNIENDIIRPTFNEPRIHFAVNCAAKSCPPLLNRAYTEEELEAQLQSQTEKFINNEKYNQLSKNEINVSRIFDWYKADFGDIVTYVNKYTDKTIKPSAKVKYNEYDWSLND